MFQNYLTTALRKLNKHRDYALLNILGLGLSVGCCILIFALLRHHFSFEERHQNARRTARIVMDVKTEGIMPFPGTPLPMSKTLREECAFLEKTAMCVREDQALVSIQNPAGGFDKYQEEDKFAWVEPDLFDILDLPLLRGDRQALHEPSTVLLSENLALKYFGEAEALGKTLRLNNETELRVVGIFHNPPANTDYKQEILASWATLKTLPGMARNLDSWQGARGDNHCFALLRAGHSMDELDPVMTDMRKRHPHPEAPDLFQYKAKPFLGLHFDTDYGFGMDKKLLWALGAIGIFLLLTACFNFINMATAQALTRVREVGVRKSLGSTRTQLFWQFMAETGLIVAVSLVIGFLMARLALPYLNTWLSEDLQFDPDLLVAVLGFTTVLGIALTFMAGAYPGLMQARFNPVISMKGVSEMPRTGGFSLRRVLVTAQFAISQVLIIGAAVITAQMQYAQDADWGFRPGVILTLDVPEIPKGKGLQQQLEQIAGVKSVSLCYQPPASSSNNHTGVVFDNRPKPEQWMISDKPADAHYLETFGLTLVAGRNLQPADTVREFLVNETFVKKLNLASPTDILNKKISVGGTGEVVGVVKDFHNWAVSEAIAAIAISTRSEDYSTCAVQLAPGYPAPVLEQIRSAWESQFPNHYYEHRFMDERVAEFLETETMILRLVRTFAGIAIFIGCLGLYGLAAFMVARKRKEVGIRKTLGASVPGILWLFGKEYTRLIVIAFALAAPVAWWAMDAWLTDYTYRISVGAGIFILSLLATCAVAVLTVGIQSVRAAWVNPVTSLRSE